MTEPRRRPSGRQPRSFRHESCTRGGGGDSGTVADRTESSSECAMSGIGENPVLWPTLCVCVYMYYIFIYKDRRGFQRPDVCARTSKVICSTRGEFSERIRIQVDRYTMLLSWPKTRYRLHDDTYTQLIRRRVQRYLLKKIGESCLSGQNGKERPLYTAKSPQRKQFLPGIGERDNCSVYAISVILHCSRSLKLKCGRPYNVLQYNNIHLRWKGFKLDFYSLLLVGVRATQINITTVVVLEFYNRFKNIRSGPKPFQWNILCPLLFIQYTLQVWRL